MHEITLPWHTLPAVDALDALGAPATGLGEEKAAARLNRYGPNDLTAADQVSAWQVLADRPKSVLIIMLLVATAISAALGHAIESIAMLMRMPLRDPQRSIFSHPVIALILIAVIWELVLLIAIVHVPILRLLLDTFSLTLSDWALVTGLAITIIPVLELAKLGVRRELFGKLV